MLDEWRALEIDGARIKCRTIVPYTGRPCLAHINADAWCSVCGAPATLSPIDTLRVAASKEPACAPPLSS